MNKAMVTERTYKQAIKRAEKAERERDELAAAYSAMSMELTNLVENYVRLDRHCHLGMGGDFENWDEPDMESERSAISDKPSDCLNQLRAKHWREAADFACKQYWKTSPEYVATAIKQNAERIERGAQ